MTPISKSTAWIYGSVSLPLAIIGYPLAVWIPRLYSTEIGIDLGLIGLVIFSAAINWFKLLVSDIELYNPEYIKPCFLCSSS